MRTAFAFAFLLAAGCSRNTPAPVAVANTSTTQSTPTGPMFDGLEYANWKQFPVGTIVKRKSVTSSETSTGTTTSIETFKLREVTDKDATVERQNTTERSDGSYKAENPPEQQKFPRQFAIPNGMTADDFTKPSRKAERAGEETVTILGKPYKATVYTWTDSTESGPMTVRVWLSEAMPGRIVKQVMRVEKLKATTAEEVVDVKSP